MLARLKNANTLILLYHGNMKNCRNEMSGNEASTHCNNYEEKLNEINKTLSCLLIASFRQSIS